MTVLAKMDKEPSKENYIDILRSGNELLRSTQKNVPEEKVELPPSKSGKPIRLLGFGRKSPK